MDKLWQVNVDVNSLRTKAVFNLEKLQRVERLMKRQSQSQFMMSMVKQAVIQKWFPPRVGIYAHTIIRATLCKLPVTPVPC